MNLPLRSLIIDDEQASRMRLHRLLCDQFKVEIVGEACDGLDAVKKIEELKPDLIFLDIQMPGLDGFGVLRAIADTGRLPLVIFVTGFDDHALAAFNTHALAYLLKPIEPKMLDVALERAWSIHCFREMRTKYEQNLKSAINEAKGARPLERIVVRKASRMKVIVPEDICLFWIDHGIVRAHTSDDRYWVNYSVGELESCLASTFFRAHRSALVNLNQVSEIRKNDNGGFQLVVLDCDQTVVNVSERQGRVLRSSIIGL